ncbi:hypothetical protein [Alicyclobacillus macrosporangiidus]|uniref:Uncharacterized protein n=1 Tax=Alicyclobacillus macrosporangiidus TaxID=392015 RepID=A0A1I7LEC5_9BACL|nr:hypothetical protein [Alicyclobacillus macrosporangiidus]SFV08030.1 hypothetical protein SAMN05421543_1415 [Alicyclobacillus macrosporangiidus]
MTELPPWRRKFDSRKFERAVQRGNAEPDTDTRFVWYECWRCEEDDNVCDGRFMVPYYSLPFYGTVYCPRCGKSDQVEQMGTGFAEITWEKSGPGDHHRDPSP